MKYKILFTCLFYSFHPLSAQKYDYNWMIGNFSRGIPEGEGILFNFNKNPLSIKFVNKKMNMYVCTNSYSNENGDFEVYTNGCKIHNAQDSLIEKGDSLNAGGIVFRDFCTDDNGYSDPQSTLFLPHPDKKKRDSIFMLVHEKVDNISISIFELGVTHFYYTEIHKGNKYKNGFIAHKKNQVLVQDTLAAGRVTACKHQNGNDWWILKNELNSNKYYTILLDSSGFKMSKKQEIGTPTLSTGNAGGQACFTPNGENYLSFSLQDGLHLFDFDRTTGALSNFRQINVSDDGSIFCGVAVSPNSRFAYVTTSLKVYQYDLQAQNIKASEKLVAQYDGFLAPFPTYFWFAQLGPDCRIYIVPRNAATVLHYIKYPDKEGLACEVVQHGITFPNGASNFSSLPNFPNYRLGTTPTYPCDSTIKLATPIADIKLPDVNFLVYPNPANYSINIEFTSENSKKGVMFISNMVGQILHTGKSTSNEKMNIDVSNYPNGLYNVLLKIEGEVMRVSKFSVLK